MKASEGSLAVYRGRPALVTGTGGKISITIGTGRASETLKVREKDLEILHPGPLKSLEDLGEPPDSAPAGSGAADLSGQADVRGAWELIESGGNPVSLEELAELIFNEFTPQSAWAAWVLLAEGLYFTGTADAIAARGILELRAAEEKRLGRARENRDRDVFLDRLRDILRSGSTPDPADPALDRRFLQDVEALAYGQTGKSRTMKDLGRSETPQEAHRLLLETGYWDTRINPHPRRFGVSPVPVETLLEESAGGFIEERRDLTGMPALAIDSPWSSDPDDALSLECLPEGRRILYVHIADPASAIYPGSQADLEARSRGATLYLPEGTWPMLSKETLSRFVLGLGGTSPALTFKLFLDSSGTITETEIFPSIIKVTRLTYEHADRLTEGAPPENGGSGGDSGTGAVLRELFTLGNVNFARRLDAGGVHIALPEIHISVDTAAPFPVVKIKPIPSFRSADMVRECMLLAGEGAAAWAARRRLPFPYVTQETGDLPSKIPEGLAGSFQLRRCMRPRSISARPGWHRGLGLEAYTQVTSPLRRYSDLLAHQQIRAALQSLPEEGRAVLDEETVLFRLAAGDAAAQALTQAERSSRAHWIAVYLEGRLKQRNGPDLVWEATAVEKRGNALGIFIPALGLETYLGNASIPLNETVTVRLKAVRIPETEIIFVEEK
ncbi:MAG: RNB domain-containing ribonuclease [Treponema sp.]|nr:RNB domain-containing ribonuclease [Treponema sp.]